MTDLQLSLIVLGCAAVLGIFGYNKWQERKQRQSTERAFRSDHADVLLEPAQAPAPEPARVEPGLSEPAAAPPAVPPESIEPPAAPRAALPPAGDIPASLADESVDCVARIEAAEPVPAHTLSEARRALFGTLEERVRLFGWSDDRAQWEPINPHGVSTYRQLAAAMQLADRRGAISANGLQVYFNGVRQLADRFLAVVELPDRAAELTKAAELDHFCAAVDVQIGVNLVASDGAGFAGTKLRGIAEAVGFRLDDDGSFHYRDESGQTLFTLSNLEPSLFAADEMKALITHGLTLTLDVPRVADGGSAFDRMIASARQLAHGLDAKLVDDNKVALSDAALKTIRTKILEFQRAMLNHGTAAGSPPALRLFA